MGEKGEKGSLMEPVAWEDHIRAVRAAVAQAFTGRKGHPVAVYLLGMVRDMAGVFSMLMDSEEHRDYYLRSVRPSWLRASQPCPWDRKAMRPILQEEPFTRYEGPRPTHHEEAAAWLALSNGMAWIVARESQATLPHVTVNHQAALLHGFEGLTPFPDNLPAPAAWTDRPGKWEMAMGAPALLMAEDLGSALSMDQGPTSNFFEAVSHYGFILPQPVRVGGGYPVFTPCPGAPLSDDLAQLLGAGSGAWPDLRFKGETRGRPWEVSFSLLCRGLEVEDDSGTTAAHWGFDISIEWNGESIGDVMEAKAAALEWDDEDWITWSLVIQAALEEAMERLRGKGAQLQAKAEVRTTATGALSTAGDARGVLSGGKTWEVVLPEGPTRMDRKAKGLVQGLFGLGISRDILKAPRWEELVAKETEKVAQEARGAKKDPFKDPRLKVERDHAGNEFLILSAPARRALREKAGTRGFVELRRDKDSSPAEWVVKRLRHGAGYAEVSFTWYSLASHLIPQAREKEKKDLEARLKAAAALGTPLFFNALDVEDQESIHKGLERLRNTDNASILAEVIQREFGRTGAYPVVIQDAAFRHVLQLENDQNGHAKVEAALNALQKLHFNLTVTGDPEYSGQAFGPFVGVVAFDPKLRAWSIELSTFAIGSLNVFKMESIRRDGLRQAFTFDFMKDLREEERKTLSYDQSATSLAPYFYTSHSFTETQKNLFRFLESHLTKTQDTARRGREVQKITKKAHQDYGKPRIYRRDFCPLIPEGMEMVGFLGWKKDSRYAESGWRLRGTPGRATETSGVISPSLLFAMGVDLPSGAHGNKRNALIKKALEDLQAVVEVAMGGLVAVKRPNGQWMTLDQAKTLQADSLDKDASSPTHFFPFAPLDWVERMGRHHVEVNKARGVAVRITRSSAVLKEGFLEAVEGSTVETETLPNRLTSARKERKLTQAQVGVLFGVSQSMVAKWEKKAKEIPARLVPTVRGWVETGRPPQ